MLLHLVDASADATVAPEEALRVVEEELGQYSPELAARPRLLVATKCEDTDSLERARALEAIAGRPVRPISAATGAGVRELLAEAHALVRASRERSPAP